MDYEVSKYDVQWSTSSSSYIIISFKELYDRVIANLRGETSHDEYTILPTDPSKIFSYAWFSSNINKKHKYQRLD